MTSQRLDRQVSRLLDEIEQAVERGDWPEVQRKATEILILDPDNDEAKAFSTAAERGLATSSTSDQRLTGRLQWFRSALRLISRVSRARPLVVPVVLAGLIVFLAADRLWLHWYVPTSETIASDFLGAWDRTLTLERGEPAAADASEEVSTPSGSLEQFRATLSRFSSAIAIERVDTAGLSPQKSIDALSECREFLFGRTDLPEPCNLVRIRED